MAKIKMVELTTNVTVLFCGTPDDSPLFMQRTELMNNNDLPLTQSQSHIMVQLSTFKTK